MNNKCTRCGSDVEIKEIKNNSYTYICSKCGAKGVVIKMNRGKKNDN